ncbi:OsmC family protein [Alphaproteobacteria bacterium KMM 3653]|uniref:OsmC family protein n=1 Tax=Harenicola maris TaxID=2841044 RepID=A0AAP2CRC3_9RHOB|nr:OsmC family protein [Harenicola maris]
MPTERNAIQDVGLPLVFQAQSQGAPMAAPRRKLAEALRLCATSLAGFQKEAYVTSDRTGLTWRLVSDEGANLNGHDAAPPPLGFFAAGLAASYMEEILALADQRGVKIGSLRVTLDNFFTMSGSMLKGTMVGGAQSVDLMVEIACDIEDKALVQLLSDSVGAAPQNGLVTGAHKSLFTLSQNGQEIAPTRVAPLNEAAIPMANAEWTPAPTGTDTTLLERVGMSPPSQTNPPPQDNGAAYSTTAPSARPLHVAAVAELRPDGMKEILQQLHFPHGSEWRFLSAENTQRAPDANTLMAAGIGFCFMTQLGILAKSQKLDLPEYAIIQDMHLSLGGASGGTSKPGAAMPAETHLALKSSEAQAKAAEMLDLAEQACFLHALCKTPLKTKLRFQKTG